LRTISILLALLVGFTAGARAQVHSETGERAEALYREGRYELAQELWRAQLDAAAEQGTEPVDTLYNVGNAAFRQRKPLEAAAWYTAAIRVQPRNEAAWHNLEFVRREAGLEPADRGDLTATGLRFASSLTLAESERVVLALAGLLALALGWEALRGGVGSRALAWVLAGCLALALVPWCWQLRHAGRDMLFVTQPEGAALLSEPRDGATLVSRAPAATEVERTDALAGWWRVRTSDGTSGWIAEPSAQALQSPWR
jgi:tetratricopeptide (TPR) repeat protein